LFSLRVFFFVASPRSDNYFVSHALVSRGPSPLMIFAMELISPRWADSLGVFFPRGAFLAQGSSVVTVFCSLSLVSVGQLSGFLFSTRAHDVSVDLAFFFRSGIGPRPLCGSFTVRLKSVSSSPRPLLHERFFLPSAPLFAFRCSNSAVPPPFVSRTPVQGGAHLFAFFSVVKVISGSPSYLRFLPCFFSFSVGPCCFVDSEPFFRLRFFVLWASS